MYSIFKLLNSQNERIRNGVLYVNNEAIGIISPTLVEGFKNSEIKKIFGPKGIIDISSDNKQVAWQHLIDAGAIIFGSNEQEVLRAKKNLENPIYSRTLSYLSTSVKNCKELNQAIDNIINAKVLIVGCGGIGSVSALLLAGAGVRNISLIDGDKIEESNLNRQILWTKADIGKLKINVLKKCILDRFSNMNINLINEKIREDIKLKDEFDIIIITADEPLSLYNNLLKNNKHIAPHKIIGSGYIHSLSTLTIGDVNKNNNLDAELNWYRNPYFIGPSFGPSNIELAGVLTCYALNQIAINSKFISFSSIWDSKKFPREIKNV